MRKLILGAVILLTALCAQAQTYGRDWVDVSSAESEEFLNLFINEKVGMYLDEWGWLKGTQLTSPQDWKAKAQIWYLLPSNFIHASTDDGDCIYDSDVSNGRVNYRNQYKLINGKVVSTDPNYDGWLKIIGVNVNDHTFLTVDNWGVYRIFSLIDASDINM